MCSQKVLVTVRHVCSRPAGPLFASTLRLRLFMTRSREEDTLDATEGSSHSTDLKKYHYSSELASGYELRKYSTAHEVDRFRTIPDCI